MAKKWEIYDLNGNRRIEEEDDAAGVLKPNRVLRVPMMMRDSAQREVAEHFQRLRTEDAARSFGLDDALALHKPGQRFVVDAAARARVEQARADGIKEMCDAWQRKPVADVSGELRGAQSGDVCTIDGAPGHLNHRLECIPDKRQDSMPRSMTMDQAQAIRDRAYEESVRELTEAWRKPLP
jgi:hypothetical protein